MQTLPSITEVPDGVADLVFVCTPAATNVELLRDAAAKGIRAAFVTSAGYGEASDDGRARQDELVALADELDMLVVGPNGQGVISTPSSMCAQIVAPYPPRGRIGIVSQSGNFVSSFMNYAQISGVGVSRAVSAGNAAQVGVADFLEFFADDPETDVALAYVEGVQRRPRASTSDCGRCANACPVVLVKGGATSSGARAAASHTGSLATDDRVFDGMCRQAGAVRASTIEEAYEAAATFATQPLPAGPGVAIVSTAGGWGVVTADAIARTDLELLSLPDDLDRAARHEAAAAVESQQPDRPGRAARRRTRSPTCSPRSPNIPLSKRSCSSAWVSSRTRDELEREGPFFPDHGLERIVGYHDRQDRRYTTTASELVGSTGQADPHRDGAGGHLTRQRRGGRRHRERALLLSVLEPCGVRLAHLWHRSRWLQRRGL